MRIIAFMTDGVSVGRILKHIGEPADPRSPIPDVRCPYGADAQTSPAERPLVTQTGHPIVQSEPGSLCPAPRSGNSGVDTAALPPPCVLNYHLYLLSEGTSWLFPALDAGLQRWVIAQERLDFLLSFYRLGAWVTIPAPISCMWIPVGFVAGRETFQ